jgi:hypothetical protein
VIEEQNQTLAELLAARMRILEQMGRMSERGPSYTDLQRQLFAVDLKILYETKGKKE